MHTEKARVHKQTQIVYINMCTHPHTPTHTHVHVKNTGDMSQSVSSWSPLGEGTMCAEEDVARLHNHSWSAWQRSMLEVDLRTDALLFFKTRLFCHALK